MGEEREKMGAVCKTGSKSALNPPKGDFRVRQLKTIFDLDNKR